MHIIKFLWENIQLYWLDIILVLGMGGVIAVLLKKGQVDKVKKYAIRFVQLSEDKFASGQGMAKLTEAIVNIKNKSAIIKWLFSDDEIAEYVEEAVYQLFNYAKEKLNENEQTD